MNSIKKTFFIFLAFVLFGCMTNTLTIPTKQGNSKFHIGEYEGTCKISYSAYQVGDLAPINDSTYESFVKVVAEVEKRNCKTKEILFSSSGGSVSAAIKIGMLINQYGYETILQLGAGCSSACGIIFIAGKERTALISKSSGESRIGFHQVSKPDAKGNMLCSEPSAPEYRAIEDYARNVLSTATSNNFIALMKSTSCKSMIYVTANDLEKLGIATKVTPHPWGI
jgi:hypothetical protein